MAAARYIEEKLDYRPKGGQRQGPLGESRVDMTRLSWVMWGEGERKGEGSQSSRWEAKGAEGTSNQNVWII